MMKYRDLIKGIIGVASICCSTILFALPSVESRTGEPVVKGSANNIVGAHTTTSSVAAPTGDMPAGVQERAARLTLREMEALQKEVSDLRGMLEVQDHEIKQLKKSQQDLYLDLDRRLSQQTGKSTVSTAKTAPATKDKEVKNKPSAVIAPENASPSSENSQKTSSVIEIGKSVAVALPDPANSAAKTKSSSEAAKPKVSESAATTNQESTTKESIQPPQKGVENNEILSYQGAYNLVKTKRYDDAVLAFQKHISQFPQGEHVANAHYWLGEVYMVQWQSDNTNSALLDKAQLEFSNIAKGFPNHTKTADAFLKLGIIELDKGNIDAAKQHLMAVKSRYPGTTAARVAENRLQQIH